METKLWQVSTENPDPAMLKAAAHLLKKGEIIAFPTETVYGLGANALDTTAIKKIYRAKGRPSDNPLIVHISALEQMEELVEEVSANAILLINNFWPGPLTLVMKKSPLVPKEISAGLETVALRMPAHPVALKLISEAAIPIAAPSANTSGKPSPTTAHHVWQDLQGKIAGIIDAGNAGVGVESTVLDITTPVPTILRPGGITLEDLEEIVGEVKLDPHLKDEASAPKSPGMKYTHYSPEAPVTIITGHDEQLVEKFLHIINNSKNSKLALMISSELEDQLKKDIPETIHKEILGSRNELAIIAANLFSGLRNIDQLDVDLIYAEAFPEKGIGAAIMNRLYKAAGGRTV